MRSVSCERNSYPAHTVGVFRETLTREPSSRAKALHLILGAALPVACLIFDPIVFKANGFLAEGDGPFLGWLRMFGYTTAAIAVVVLTRACFTRITAIETGMLYCAALVALTLGVVMLPVTLIGLLVLTGILGFAPFLAAWVYLRHAARQRAMRPSLVVAGALLFLAIPALAQLAVDRTVERAIARGTPVSAVLRPLYDTEQLVDRYLDSSSNEEKQRLAVVYRSMTGRYLEERLAQLSAD